MGRRSKADMLDLVERIVDMHDREKLTFAQIADRLQGEDIGISRESARRTYANAEAKAAKYKFAAENAKAIVEASKGTNTDLAEAANSVLTNMFYEKVIGKDDLDFKDDTALLKAMAPVMHNQVELAQARLNYEQGVEKTKAAVYDALAKELEGNPELLAQLKTAISGLKVKEK
jgi:IS30 family transposase